MRSVPDPDATLQQADRNINIPDLESGRPLSDPRDPWFNRIYLRIGGRDATPGPVRTVENQGSKFPVGAIQVWDFAGQIYEMAMFFVVDDGGSQPLTTQVMRTKDNAVGTDQLLALMRQAGFRSTERLDGCFYQPVLVGNRET